MTPPVVVDPVDLFREAQDLARTQESEASAVLWERLAQRVASDEEFRRLVERDPRRATEQVAQTLQDPSGQALAVDAETITAVAKRAVETYSTAVPEVASQKVENLIFGTIEDFRRSFKLSLVMSQVLFYAGLVITLGAFVSSWLGHEKTSSLLFGASGVGSMLISALVTGPLDRVQNAAARLLQLQMAYLAYYKQLYLLGGGTAPLTRADAIAYAREIERAAVTLITSVQAIHAAASRVVQTTDKTKAGAVSKPAPTEDAAARPDGTAVPGQADPSA